MDTPLVLAPNRILDAVRDNPLFEGLQTEDFSRLMELMQPTHLARGDYLFHEGDPADRLFIVVDGDVEILKEESVTKSHHRLAVMTPGSSVGEVALMDGDARSASAIALTDCELIGLDIAQLASLESRADSLTARIKINLGGQMARKLRNINEVTVRVLQEQLSEAKARVTAGVFVITTFIAICTYVFLLQIASQFIHSKLNTSALSIPGFLAFSTAFYIAVKRSGETLRNYGLNARNWRVAIVEACIFSIPLLLLAVFAKWMLIRFHPAMHNDELFTWSARMATQPGYTLAGIIGYSFFSPFQEFIVRGAIQGSFEDFLTGKRKALQAILMANLMFAMLHLYMSVLFSVMVFIPGLVWGWLYSRNRTLIGVSISHALVGIFGFFVVGFDTLIEIYA